MTVRRDFIAIVDDDPQTLKSLTRLLSATGYRPVPFASAQEFLSSVGTSKAACLLLDVGLGAHSGFELARHSAVHALGLPLIFMGGAADDGVRKQALAAGAVAFLLKPFRAAELLDALARAIQNGAMRRPTLRSAHPPWTAAAPAGESPAVRVIRKRANRRLLDVARNRYVNLADLRTMVIQHAPLVILDKNGLDITRETLLQAVIEQELGEHPVLTCEFLKQMIRCTAGGPRAGSLRAYLDECVSRWSKSQDPTID
jgi:polyhydroxyalkanoate synthesis repressor PhaR